MLHSSQNSYYYSKGAVISKPRWLKLINAYSEVSLGYMATYNALYLNLKYLKKRHHNQHLSRYGCLKNPDSRQDFTDLNEIHQVQNHKTESCKAFPSIIPMTLL
jgi:hypothetical protein